MLIYFVYLTHGKICDRLYGYKDTDLASLKYIIKFRIRNNRLPVEVGCWTNINYEDRQCELCDPNCAGDEFHYILECSYFNCERNKIIESRRLGLGLGLGFGLGLGLGLG